MSKCYRVSYTAKPNIGDIKKIIAYTDDINDFIEIIKKAKCYGIGWSMIDFEITEISQEIFELSERFKKELIGSSI